MNAVIYQSDQYSLWPDRVLQDGFTAKAISETEITSNYPMQDGAAAQEKTWKLATDLSQYPAYHSSQVLSDAIYNLSLEDLTRDISKEGTFDAGAKWPGVWTRDVSYSILLSLAAIDPQRAEASLMRKVKRERIVQDTGTGGSWPVSTDRVCWALAAWEIYLVTGDRKWLEESSRIVENSIHDDEQVVIDPESGLARGESSFMDWREQTYPKWMEPADIYSSRNLGTNAVYYRVFRILAAMDRELGRPARDWDAKAERIRNAMNDRMWLRDKGRYGQYLYGRVQQTLSPRSDALGESLAVLFDIPSATQQRDLMSSQPLMPFGIPTVYPETPNIPPYHNRSVWPFVQAFWNLAAAKENEQAILLHGIASIYRAAALFLTNKENFVAVSGTPIGTAVNSDRQLWSVAGSLAMVYRVFFGMEFEVDGLHLHPVIPEPLNGIRTLTNFHYRNAVLSIVVKGFGNSIRTMTMDGKLTAPVVPMDLSGPHSIEIELDNRPHPGAPLKLVKEAFAPDTPVAERQADTLSWSAIDEASQYRLYRNAVPGISISDTHVGIDPGDTLNQFQIAAVAADGTESFLSAPIDANNRVTTISAVPSIADHAGAPYITLEQNGTTGLSIAAEVPADGRYALSFRYSNGSGPVTTDNKCAVRTVFIDGRRFGAVVFPQRGKNEWENWGWSNLLVVQLMAGKHTVELRLLPANLNMDGAVNRAQIRSIRLERLD